MKKVANKDLDNSHRERFRMSTFSDTKLKISNKHQKEEKPINFVNIQKYNKVRKLGKLQVRVLISSLPHLLVS